MNAITINNLWEKYRIKFIVDGKVSWDEIWALENICLNINKGEVVGIIGQNGAGKTTFLRLLAGMLVPDRGEIHVEGRVAAIMELGAGLNPEFTGRENIVLNARIYGIGDDVLKQKIEEIIVFSNLGKFIDAPIKYYSQGMYMRLAFALAIFAEPDILLIDDILAVGDEEAQQKCRKKIVELKGSGKTIILVSHDMGMINKLCDRVVLLEKGKITREGHPQSVIPCYLETAGEKTGIGLLEEQGLRVVFNNGSISISYLGNYVSGTFGGYCSSFDSLLKIHSPSTNLFWRITSNSVAELIAEGRNKEDGAPLQYFKMNLFDNVLDLSIRSVEASKRQHSFNLFLLSTYSRWVLPDREGVTPNFSHRTNWHDLGLDASSGIKIGLFNEIENLLPSLIFETKEKDSALKIFNSGYDQESRIVNLSSQNSQELFLSIKVYPDKKVFENCFIQERELLLFKRQEEEARRLEEERLAKEAADRQRQEEEARRLEEERLVKEAADRQRQEEEARRLEEERLAKEAADRQRQEEEARRLEEERLAKEAADRQRQEEEARRLEEERLAKEAAQRRKKEQEDAYLKEHTIVSGDCRLFIDESARRMQIFYRDIEITAAGGVHSILPFSQLNENGFEVRKVSEDQLVLSLHFNSFTQIWDLAFQGTDILVLKISLEIKAGALLDRRYLLFEFSDIYQDWQIPDEEGVLSNEQYLNDIAPIRFKNSRVNSIALSSRQGPQPRLIFDIEAKNNYIVGLFKRRDGNAEIICLNFQSVVPWIERELSPGFYDLFDIKIVFNSQEELKKGRSLTAPMVISNHNLKLAFNNGKGSIFCGEKELTFGLGVYSAVRIGGIWYDSCQAMWTLVKKDKQSIVVLGRWPYIPISQLWELELITDNRIRWKINMEVHQEVNIEIGQANIMLTEKYKDWFVKDVVGGKFVDDFTSDYDILPFRYWYGEAPKKGLIAGGSSLPAVNFFNEEPDKMPRALIENSDFLYHSRLLQYQKNNSKLLEPKNYLYFSGAIEIVNK